MKEGLCGRRVVSEGERQGGEAGEVGRGWITLGLADHVQELGFYLKFSEK